MDDKIECGDVFELDGCTYQRVRLVEDPRVGYHMSEHGMCHTAYAVNIDTGEIVTLPRKDIDGEGVKVDEPGLSKRLTQRLCLLESKDELPLFDELDDWIQNQQVPEYIIETIEQIRTHCVHHAPLHHFLREMDQCLKQAHVLSDVPTHVAIKIKLQKVIDTANTFNADVIALKVENAQLRGQIEVWERAFESLMAKVTSND